MKLFYIILHSLQSQHLGNSPFFIRQVAVVFLVGLVNVSLKGIVFCVKFIQFGSKHPQKIRLVHDNTLWPWPD